jgi:hypothetical protein
MPTFMMWTLGHMQHEQDCHWFEYESMVKNDFHHIWLCVKPFDRKVGCTTTLDWPHVIGVFVMVFRSMTTFIPTKQNFHSIKSKDTRTTNPRTYQNDQWKGFISLKPYQVCPRWFLIVRFFALLKEKFLEMFHSYITMGLYIYINKSLFYFK